MGVLPTSRDRHVNVFKHPVGVFKRPEIVLGSSWHRLGIVFKSFQNVGPHIHFTNMLGVCIGIRPLLRGGYMTMMTTFNTHTLKTKSTSDADRSTDGECIYQETGL